MTVIDAIVLAAIRPDDWNLALFLHVLGAMALVGALILSAVALFASVRRGAGFSEPMSRLAFRSLAWGAIPAWVVMRGAAQWIADKEGLDGEEVDLTWLNIGWTTGDMGALLLFIATGLAYAGLRRARRGETVSGLSSRVSTGLVWLLVIAYLVTIWAMTAKPV